MSVLYFFEPSCPKFEAGCLSSREPEAQNRSIQMTSLSDLISSTVQEGHAGNSGGAS